MKPGILYIINMLGHGGAEKQLAMLVHGLKSSELKPHVAVLQGGRQQVIDENIAFMSLQVNKIISFDTFRAILELVQYIKKNNIQIIQAFFQDPVILGCILKLCTSAKLIVSFRDLGFWKTPLLSRKMKIAYKYANGFIANSEAVKEYYVREDGVPAKSVKVIYNGVLSGEKKVLNEDVSRSKIIGIVANFNRAVKRVDDFIKMASIVHQAEKDWKFEIIGTGHLKSQLEMLVKKLNLQGVVRFVGSVTNPTKYISQFSIGCLCSETEGLSNAILEYMCQGLPVVATRTGGNPELINHGENGFLYQVGNTDEFSKYIIELVRNEVKRKQMGEINREKVLHQFSPDKMVQHHIQFYRKWIIK